MNVKFRDECTGCHKCFQLPSKVFVVDLRTNTYHFKCPLCLDVVLYATTTEMANVMVDSGSRVTKGG